MLIVGSGGLAKDIIASMEEDANGYAENVVLFDNVSTEHDKLFGHYPILHTFDEVTKYFSESPANKNFIVCIGNPIKRYRLAKKIMDLGGIYTAFISNKTCAISPFTELKSGAVVQQGSIISRDAVVSEGVFLNAGVVLGHDVILQQYVSIGPGARILGNVEVGEFSYIGCNAVITPGVKIGKKVRIGIGKVIDHDIPDNSKVM